MAKKIVTFDCPDCSSTYISQLSARECCPIEIESKTSWGCDVCENEFDTKHEANECCANETLDKFEGRKPSEVCK